LYRYVIMRNGSLYNRFWDGNSHIAVQLESALCGAIFMQVACRM
jgi:hypothetical protein